MIRELRTGGHLGSTTGFGFRCVNPSLKVSSVIEPSYLGLLPPAVAIVLAIATRRIVASLAVGVLVGIGCLTLARGESIAAAARLTFDIARQSLFDTDHLLVLASTVLLGAMVGVLERGGSMLALIVRVSKWFGLEDVGDPARPTSVRNRTRAQQLISATGLVIFFDDYANMLLVGGTMRTTADRYRLSREKLAYLVDSTSAPIAGLAVISTWAAVEMAYMAEGLQAAGVGSAGAFELFWLSIPYRFYPVLALILVAITVITGRDFGPMAVAEAKAWRQPPPVDLDDGEMDSSGDLLHWAAIVPIALCLATVLIFLAGTGWAGVELSGNVSWSMGSIEVLGAGNPYIALTAGGVAGLLASLFLPRRLATTAWSTLRRGAIGGTMQMLPAMVILWFAWALTSVCNGLRTGDYLAAVVFDHMTPLILPSVVFLVAGGIAFATGTSWGTMGLLTPLVVQLAVEIASSEDSGVAITQHPLVLGTTGAVLAGAIFGDHCSPISDTTILSSRSSGCDHLAHVSTQWPYAMLAGIVAVASQTLITILGGSPWLWIGLGGGVLVMWVRVFGRSPAEEN